MVQSIEVTELVQAHGATAPKSDHKKKVAHKVAKDLSRAAATIEKNAKKKKHSQPTVVAQFGANDDHSCGGVSGIYAVLAQIASMIFSIQGLQNANTGLLEKLSKILAKTSNEEAERLEADAIKIQWDAKNDKKEQLAADNAAYQKDMTIYNNQIQSEQTQVQNYTTLTGDQSKSISTDAQYAQSVIAILTDVASLLR